MAQLVLNIGQHLPQVTEVLWLKAYDCPCDGGLYQDLWTKIYLVILPIFIDKIVQEMTCMSRVRSAGSPRRRATGTSTSATKTIPPIQVMAARRCSQRSSRDIRRAPGELARRGEPSGAPGAGDGGPK